MTVTSEHPGVGQRVERPRTGLTWHRLVIIAGVGAALATGAVAVYLTDLEGGVVAVVIAASTWLFWSGRRLTGVTGLIFVSAVTLYFMGTAALTNLRGWAGAEGTLIALGLAATSSLVLIACLGWLTRRGSEGSFGPWTVVLLVVAGLAVLTVGGVAGDEPQRASADLDLVADNVAYSADELVAPAGEVTVSLENKDLFWHTFTIEELGVDLRVPVSADITVTFDAPPGEYRYFCDIPGHPEAGMEGILVVEG